MIPTVEYISSSLRRTLVHLCRWHRIKYLLLLHFIVFLCMKPNAQISISLNGAIDSAIKNNLTINNERLKTSHAKALIKAAANIPVTNVAGEFGQINSSYFDTKFGVSQSFSFPTVYAKQRLLFTEEWKAALMGVSLKEIEIKKAVSETFYNYIYWKEKEKLLTDIDSLYSKLMLKAGLRLQKGESNVLEKTTFETQKTAVDIQLIQVRQEIETLEQIFQMLLNTNTKFVPSTVELKMQDIPYIDLETPPEDHPALKLMTQQQQIAKANTQIEKSKLLPDLLLGYNNTSMRGMGADERLYNAGNRFHTAQVGIGIPLFASAQKARIKASRINEQVAINNFNIEKESLKTKMATAFVQYYQHKRAVALYENQYLKNVAAIKETANKQFLNGEINYLDFVMLINQSVNIQNSYTDAVQRLNQSIIELNYLNSKN